MRLAELVMGGLIAVGCAGCPGTIEDPSGFQALEASQRDGGGTDSEDAAAEASTSLPDAALDSATVEDAQTVEEAATSELDANSGWDGALPDAGGWQGPMPEAGVDSGVGCDFQGLIMRKCGRDGSCHEAPAISSGLDLTSPDLAARIAGRTGSNDCASNLLVDPAAPQRSALYLMVMPGACGAGTSRMPLGGSLTDVEQACILRWIENQN